MPFHSLPPELQQLVHEHAAALTIQRRWRRHSLWAHARQAGWSEVRDHLQALGAWRTLARYSKVRREWRTEPGSWLSVDAATAAAIAAEAREGLWG